MEESSAGSPRDEVVEQDAADASPDALIGADWSAVRGELEAFVALGESFATSSRGAMESVSRLERESEAVLRELEGQRVALEREAIGRLEELQQIRRQIEAERLDADRALRELLEARQAAEREAAAIIPTAQRQAEDVIAIARRRAAEIERDAIQKRAAMLSESQALGRQVRELDERINRLLHWSGPEEPAAVRAFGDDEVSPAADAVRADDEMPEQLDALPPSTWTEDATNGGQVGRDVGPSTLVAPPAHSRSELLPPADPATRPTDAMVSSREVTEETEEREPRFVEEREPELVQEPEEWGPRTTTLVFDEVRGFQTVLTLERALKSIAHTSDVVVGDFVERRLTMQVTHEMGDDLPEAILALKNVRLELLGADSERAEFRVRS